MLHKLLLVCYSSCVAIEWANSADKHRISREDAVHAIAHRLYYVQEFDRSRTGGHNVDLFVGPGRDGQLLEVMIEPIPPRDAVVFHVMPARQKIIDQARRKAQR